MPPVNEKQLSALLSENGILKFIEPHIYSVLPDIDTGSSYDTKFGDFYDRVGCNPIYNRLVWGYSTSRFASFTRDALESSANGPVLDLGCGSLAFTTKTYAQYTKRPVVLLDQSIKLLRIAKSRIIRLNGKVPDNMVFLHGDALDVPFASKAFRTIVSLNLLHVLADIEKLFASLKNILDDDGKMGFTTLIKAGRLADAYLKFWENAGELVARDMAELKKKLEDLGMQAKYDMKGNMAFIQCERLC